MNKKKIAIITIYSMNFGNRLQNYAVHKILSDMDFNCETVVCQRSFLRHLLRNAYHWVGSLLHKKNSVKVRSFFKFVKRTTPVRFVYNKQLLIPKEIAGKYDYCVTGSDQVWNPEIRVKEKPNFFLDFAPEAKRVCIAPSFGVSEIPSQHVGQYKCWLNSFQYLSCREAEGVNIIEKLTGKEASLLIDPTMMLDREMWEEIYCPIELPEKPYILLYFLGGVSAERQKIIQKLAEDHQLIIVDPLKSQDKKYDELQPDGLLQLIDGASFVCTDSFHLTAFSINFNIPFFVFSRESKEAFGNHMISRITSLLELFNFCDRLDPKDCTNAFPCDFSRSNNIIEAERTKEREYLKRCFEIAQ